MPIIFHRLDQENYPEESIIFLEVEPVKIWPKQGNGHDCGVFVMKYIDCILTCSTDNWVGRDWDDDVLTIFRHRIGWELHKKLARHPMETANQARLAGL